MVAFLVEHDDVTYQSVLFIQNRFPIETFKCKRCSLSAITPAVDAFLQTGRKPLVLSLDYILLYKRGMCHRGRIIRDRAIAVSDDEDELEEHNQELFCLHYSARIAFATRCYICDDTSVGYPLTTESWPTVQQIYHPRCLNHTCCAFALCAPTRIHLQAARPSGIGYHSHRCCYVDVKLQNKNLQDLELQWFIKGLKENAAIGHTQPTTKVQTTCKTLALVFPDPLAFLQNSFDYIDIYRRQPQFKNLPVVEKAVLLKIQTTETGQMSHKHQSDDSVEVACYISVDFSHRPLYRLVHLCNHTGAL